MSQTRKRLNIEATMDVPPPPPEMRVTVDVPPSTRINPTPSFKDYVKNSTGYDNFIQTAANYIKRNEGVKYSLYKDSYGHWTIGIGHLVTPQEIQYFKNRTLTENEVMALFRKDLDLKIKAAKRQFGSMFDTFSDKLKIAIIDGYFRGDLPGSPNTIALLKQRKFKQAATEYLNNNEYRAALKPSSNAKGVAKRMQMNANVMFAEV